MKLGFDIDNVISDFNGALMKEYLAHDKEINGGGIVNADAWYITRGMFSWPQDEVQRFYDDNIERIARDLPVIDGAREGIARLRREGHEIYLITGRDNGEYSDPRRMTEEWLKRSGIEYDGIFYTNAYKNEQHGKAEICLENGIELMIDDSPHICRDCIEKGVPTVIVDTPFNRTDEFERVYGWEEILNYIKGFTL